MCQSQLASRGLTTAGKRLDAVRQAAAALEAQARAKEAEAEAIREKARREAEAAKEKARQLELEAKREKARLDQQQEAERIEKEKKARETKRQEDIAYHNGKIAELSTTVKKVQGRIELVKKATKKPRPEVEGVAVTPLDSISDDAYTYYTDLQKDIRLASLEKELKGLESDKKFNEDALRRLGS